MGIFNFLSQSKPTFPLPRKSFPFPFPRKYVLHSNSHGNPMGFPFPRGIPFPCTSLVHAHTHTSILCVAHVFV